MKITSPLRKVDSTRMKFCNLVPFGFAVCDHQFDSGWKQYLSGILWSRDTTIWFCLFVHIKFWPIAFYCIIIQLCESIFPICVHHGLNSTSAENSHVTDCNLIRTIYERYKMEYLHKIYCVGKHGKWRGQTAILMTKSLFGSILILAAGNILLSHCT
jgi:hypothetical protein